MIANKPKHEKPLNISYREKPHLMILGTLLKKYPDLGDAITYYLQTEIGNQMKVMHRADYSENHTKRLIASNGGVCAVARAVAKFRAIPIVFERYIMETGETLEIP